MTKTDPVRLRLLQRTCARALRLHTDLAEASCEILLSTDPAGLSPDDRARLGKLGQEEIVALTVYNRARTELFDALSLDPESADGRACPAVGARN